jgi:hypothetical protein
LKQPANLHRSDPFLRADKILFSHVVVNTHLNSQKEKAVKKEWTSNLQNIRIVEPGAT